jgi:hypothetical protein
VVAARENAGRETDVGLQSALPLKSDKKPREPEWPLINSHLGFFGPRKKIVAEK